MVEYLQKIKNFVDNLVADAEPVSDYNLILYVLGDLGLECDALVVSVTSRVDPILLADLQKLLLSHEIGLSRLLLLNKNSNKNDTLFKRNQVSNQSYGGKYGCGRSRCSRNNNQNHSQPVSNVSQCQVCNEYGHTAITCYHRFDHAYQSNAKQQIAVMVAQPSIVIDPSWELLSRASMKGAKPILTSMVSGLQLPQHSSPPFDQPKLYRSIVGAL
ncbi:hypothetical protein CQW23_06136 [Capsicum baccatum]|uniref:Uncharacterized protein n=1 Tax=Capsicum baccatum TaxID=33114 RepID=A0A2G2X2F2_CAPBA|nr:hypothetical protein CQW23_06136 [Capsicum baccatum]